MNEILNDEISMEQKIIERSYKIFLNTIKEQAVGNYTKSYETYKRVQNVVKSFQDELEKKNLVECSVLDLGCGDGYHVFLLNSIPIVQKRKVSFIGIDSYDVNVSFANHIARKLNAENVNFKVGDIETDLALPETSFDIILCTDVIEHLEFSEKLIEQIRKILKHNGIAIITTPNKDNMVSKVRRLFIGKNSKNKKSSSAIDEKLENSYEHISVKGLKEWLTIFRKKGFVIEKVRRGALLFGGHSYNKHPNLFAFGIILDKILDFSYFIKSFSEAHTYIIRKK